MVADGYHELFQNGVYARKVIVLEYEKCLSVVTVQHFFQRQLKTESPGHQTFYDGINSIKTLVVCVKVKLMFLLTQSSGTGSVSRT